MNVKSKEALWKEAEKERREKYNDNVFGYFWIVIISAPTLLYVCVLCEPNLNHSIVVGAIIIIVIIVAVILEIYLFHCLVRWVVFLTKKKTKKMVLKIYNSRITRLESELKELPKEMLEEYKKLSSALVQKRFTIVDRKELKLTRLVSLLKKDQKTLSQNLDSLEEKFEKKRQEIEDGIKHYQQIMQ
ncbi:MAG: hypothetical protein LBU27_05270 [Candidatus Peribacteria bacterium]|jgi:cell division protein FtsW (lipid II flippase)|nr:hypothetical protein [Candidatus Peribacteria bacterium]